jgi:tRNA A-37 threonylcarbamoyl transferase component Bud32
MDDPPQHLRDDRYAVIRLLGEGGQASTFEAVDKKRGTLVAIKRFRVRGAKSWKEVELAEREARVLSSLEHPALPRYIEHFEEGGELFLVTDKIEGESLAALRKSGRSLTEREVVRLLRDAEGALTYLHARPSPIVHRDIKPSNVIQRPDGSFALIDFGAVRHGMKPEGGSTVVGTFGYMAPEQFQGRAMPASDIYAVGATALAMLTGREPEALPHRGLAIDVEASLRGVRVDPTLVRALGRMLEPDPDRRATNLGPLLATLETRAASTNAPRAAAASSSRGTRASGPAHASSFSERARPRASAPSSSWAQGIPGDPRALRREARAARKQMKREIRALRRGGRHIGPPALILILLLLGLSIAQVAVLLALRVVVPTVLMLVSIVFGRAVRDAAKSVAASGHEAADAIERAKDFLRGRSNEEDPRPRVDLGADPGARVRVGPSDAAEAEAEAEAEADDYDDRDDVTRGRSGRRR